MFRVPSASALGPSNTAAATNANPSLTGPTFISSAAVLQQNSIISSNAISSQNIIESGSGFNDALSAIAEQTPGSRFSTEGGIFNTSKLPTQEQTGLNAQKTSPISTFSNSKTESPIFQSALAITGRNATVDSQGAANFAAVNAGYNVNLSQEGSQAIKSLQNSAALFALQNTPRMDGMIPIAPSTPTDTNNSPAARGLQSNVFDNITESFNNIMKGGGHGGGGGSGLSNPRKEPKSQIEQDKNKKINFLG